MKCRVAAHAHGHGRVGKVDWQLHQHRDQQRNGSMLSRSSRIRRVSILWMLTRGVFGYLHSKDLALQHAYMLHAALALGTLLGMARSGVGVRGLWVKPGCLAADHCPALVVRFVLGFWARGRIIF
jgi:hypothetical protein